jgi:hypothetical protein
MADILKDDSESLDDLVAKARDDPLLKKIVDKPPKESFAKHLTGQVFDVSKEIAKFFGYGALGFAKGFIALYYLPTALRKLEEKVGITKNTEDYIGTCQKYYFGMENESKGAGLYSGGTFGSIVSLVTYFPFVMWGLEDPGENTLRNTIIKLAVPLVGNIGSFIYEQIREKHQNWIAENNS